ICDEMKSRPGGLNRCFRCRNAALQKAIQTRRAFGGLCINGIYEYVRPLVVDGETVCVIYVGDILPEESERERLYRRISGKEHLLQTLEPGFEAEKCEAVARVVESYIRMLLESAPVSKKQSALSPLIENMKKYVEENLEYGVTLPQLACIFHYNEKYLGRMFKARVGISFSEYVNRQRLSRAKNLLLQTDCSIIDVALRTGFPNVTYFNRLFKRYTGLTPTQMRHGGGKQK
ncbi:MAG: helix-turn-helix domain-containing protein, partial [Clostridia bacterium]|nr:helix-turn-helix domain-containing protein [Clostridia bacterium]